VVETAVAGWPGDWLVRQPRCLERPAQRFYDLQPLEFGRPLACRSLVVQPYDYQEKAAAGDARQEESAESQGRASHRGAVGPPGRTEEDLQGPPAREQR